MSKQQGLLLVIYFFLLVPMLAAGPINLPSPEKATVQNNSLIGVSEPCYLSPEKIRKEEAINKLLTEIIKRESNGIPDICNLEFGCKAGMGLTGIIPKTLSYCEEKLDRSLDVFNPQDNIACARWLLENEGIRHWEEWSGPYPEHLVRCLY